MNIREAKLSEKAEKLAEAQEELKRKERIFTRQKEIFVEQQRRIDAEFARQKEQWEKNYLESKVADTKPVEATNDASGTKPFTHDEKVESALSGDVNSSLFHSKNMF